MQPYRTKSGALAGSSWAEVYKNAQKIYKKICAKSKRRPYIRSTYFKKDKIFLGLFWEHLHSKLSLKDKTRRLKYFACAIELIQQSHLEPVSKQNVDRNSEILHRFTGISAEKEIFFVQIKQDKRSGQKYFMSVFPLN